MSFAVQPAAHAPVVNRLAKSQGVQHKPADRAGSICGQEIHDAQLQELTDERAGSAPGIFVDFSKEYKLALFGVVVTVCFVEYCDRMLTDNEILT